MSIIQKLAIILSVLFALSISAHSQEYAECRTTQQCGPDYCCAVGFTRFSSPNCRPLGDIGDNCFQNNEPSNRVLHYPNQAVEVFNVYSHFCPCKSHLICRRNVCTAPKSTYRKRNSLWYYYY